MIEQQELQTIREDLKSINDRFQKFTDHNHNGFDSDLVDQLNIYRKIIYKDYTIYGADAATGANYGVFCIVPIACVVTGFQEVHQTAGNDAGAVTLMLEKLTGTTAPGSGSDVLSTTLSLKATADTVQDGALTLTLADKTLKVGDRLALEDTGTLTTLANVTVKVELTVL